MPLETSMAATPADLELINPINTLFLCSNIFDICVPKWIVLCSRLSSDDNPFEYEFEETLDHPLIDIPTSFAIIHRLFSKY